MAGSPVEIAPTERAVAYAESVLDGRETPAQAALRIVVRVLGEHGVSPAMAADARARMLVQALADCEASITDDMEVLRSWLAMAWVSGYVAGAK